MFLIRNHLELSNWNILSLGLIQYGASPNHCQHSTVLLPKWPQPDASFTVLNAIVWTSAMHVSWVPRCSCIGII
ncbi:hypothetical protein AOLI_G00229350 [Acnodon oligacanthus]